MIKTFKCKETEGVYHGRFSRRLPRDSQRAAARKLEMLSAATLKVPPGNMLEKLSGDRVGQHGIRINDQWRVCFVWRDGDAYDVEIVDCH